MARQPSPQQEARRRQPPEDDWEGATHTMVGRRTLWTILIAAIVLTLGIVIGMAIVSKRDVQPIDIPASDADIPVLKNPGPWKVKPDSPDAAGVEVEGQGRVLFGTGEGRDPGGTIALDAVPEQPMEIPPAGAANTPPLPAASAAPKEAEKAEPAAKPAPEKPAPPPSSILPDHLRPKEAAADKPAASAQPAQTPAATPATGGSASVQLGAFSTSAAAHAAWSGLSTRFSYLAGHTPVILPVSRDGKTLYRLRTSAGSAAEAQDICARLKVAGEACSVVR